MLPLPAKNLPVKPYAGFAINAAPIKDDTDTNPLPPAILTPVSVIGQRQWTDTQYAGLDGGADANFAAMPQVGGDPIVESGSNADGEWTRWADGTQTAVKRQAQTGVSIAGGGFVDISSLMGAAFIANPAYGLTGRFFASNGSILYGFFASSFDSNIAMFSNIGTSPSVTAPEWNTTGTTTATSYFVDICAIGRWK